MIRVKLKTNSFIAKLAAKKLKVSRIALTFHRTIYLHNACIGEFLKNEKWVRHEIAHIRQYKKDGTIIFLLKYTWWSIRYGYNNNPYEIEARLKEEDDHIMNGIEIC